MRWSSAADQEGELVARVPNREDFDSDEEYDGALYALEAPDDGE